MNVTPPSSTFEFLKPPDGTRTTAGEGSSFITTDSRVTAALPTKPGVGDSSREKSIPNIPGYELLRELGRGGMGVVYLARQKNLGRLVALKMMSAGVLSDDEELIRFRAEAEIVSQLQHPNIVQVYEIGEHEGYAFFSMEYVAGGTLARRIYRRTLPPKDAAQMVRTLALAVQAAHDKGIIHRDLKPGNVLLLRPSMSEESGTDEELDSTVFLATDTPKLTDFGLAKRLQAEGLTQSGMVLGTPEYMAPEQALGLSSLLGPAVDIYALGAILYELITGKPPFKGASPLDTIQQVVMEELVPPSHLQPKTPPDLETICLKCLRKESGHRYLSARALAEDLDRFLQGQPILARPVGPLERAVKWARRKPALAGLYALAFLALTGLTVGVGLLWQANTREAELRQAAESHAQKARANERTALDNLRLAKKAVDDLAMAVTNEPPFNEERMRAARRSLLERALPFYEQFQTAQSDDPRVLEDAANHRYRLGMLTEEIVGKEEARAHYAEALQLWRRLTVAWPENLTYRHEEARSLIHLGRMYYRLGRTDDAETCAQQAQRLGDSLRTALPSATAYQKTLADATVLLGMVQSSVGKRTLARQNYELSLALYEQLSRQQPEEMALLAQLATTWNRLGEACDERQIPQAIEYFQKALHLYQKVATAQPDNSTYQADMASVLNNLGSAYRQKRVQDAYATAKILVQQELLILEKLTTAYPEVIDYQARLMAAWNRLGTLQMETPPVGAAKASLQRALEINQRLTKSHPEVLDYQVHLGWVLYYLGVQASYERLTEPALEWFIQADKQLTWLEGQYPKEIKLREQRRLLHRIWAITHEQAGQPREALQQWDKALAASDRRRVEFLHHQGVCWARLGDWTRAEAMAAEVTAHPVQNGIVLMELARIHSLCYQGAKETNRRERHAIAALHALRRALEGKYLRWGTHQTTLREDPDFAALRQRPDFQALLKELPPPQEKQ